MKILRFEGATMRDAIAKVKAELGDQAVIISTRQVRRGLLGGTAVEISAAIDDGDDQRAPGGLTGPTHGLGHGSAYGMHGPTSGGPLAGAGAAAAPAPPRPSEQDVEKLLAPLRNELRSLRALVRAADSNRTTGELRAELQQLRKLVEDLRSTPPAARAASSTQPPSIDAPLTRASTGRVLMLVGPTGAGKTTTIAKLAANAALVDGKRVRLVTLDNYRVGGIDQIRTFADLIGVPLQIADSPAALAAILADDEHELTLIDTAGRSPRDTAAIDELAGVLPGLPAIEVHLVIPAAASAAAIDELAARYRSLAPARLLFTKLDEVERAAELAEAPVRTRLPITWLTTGQAVPEDIEQPTSARVVELASIGLSPDAHATTRNRGHRAA